MCTNCNNHNYASRLHCNRLSPKLIYYLVDLLTFRSYNSVAPQVLTWKMADLYVLLVANLVGLLDVKWSLAARIAFILQVHY